MEEEFFVKHYLDEKWDWLNCGRFDKFGSFFVFLGSPYVETDGGASDSMSLGFGKQTEFDRRKKKKWVLALFKKEKNDR